MAFSNIIEVGMKKPHTLKLKANINGVLMLLLVDSIPTHNFIDGKLVRALGLTEETIETMSIKLGYGFQSTTKGKCSRIEVEVGSTKFTI